MLSAGHLISALAQIHKIQTRNRLKALFSMLLLVAFGTLPLPAWAGDFPGKGSRAKWEEAMGYGKLGVQQFNNGNLSDAQKSFEKAIDTYDQDPAFHYNLGYVYRKMNQFNKAEYYYKHALKMDPNDGTAWISLGWIYNAQDKTQESLNAYKNANNCNLSPKQKQDVNSFINVLEKKLALSHGEDSYKKGNYDKALVDLDKAIALDSKSGEAYYLRGKVYEKLGQTSEAQSDFARSKELDYKPKHGEQE